MFSVFLRFATCQTRLSKAHQHNKKDVPDTRYNFIELHNMAHHYVPTTL